MFYRQTRVIARRFAYETRKAPIDQFSGWKVYLLEVISPYNLSDQEDKKDQDCLIYSNPLTYQYPASHPAPPTPPPYR